MPAPMNIFGNAPENKFGNPVSYTERTQVKKND